MALLAGRCVHGRDYLVAVMNGTDALISEATVKFNGFRSVGGWIRPGVSKRHGGVTLPIPAYAEVQWRSADGVFHTERVAVRSALPPGYRGDLWFVIRPGNKIEVRTAWPKQWRDAQ